MDEEKITLDKVILYFKRRSVIALCIGGFFIFSLLAISHRSSNNAIITPYRGLSPVAQGSGNWRFERDRNNFVLSQEQCDKAFPDLYDDIYRAARDRAGKKITLQEIDQVPVRNGYVRGMVYNQQLYIIQTEGNIYSRGFATLLAMNRAITSSPEPIPNIEFTFSADDWLPPAPQWALARKTDDRQTWLMPDFGYWSWPETKVGSYGEVLDKALEMEKTLDNESGKRWSWQDKIPKLLWRGAIMDLPLRKKLVEVTKDKDWADVKALDWHNKESTSTDLKSMAEHCQYKYLVNTAGNSYSGRLKYIQNCHSVIIMHEMEWFTHHTHLMKKEGPEQNYVEVDREFNSLENVTKGLMADDSFAQKVADNNVKTFRDRYLTPSAEACYWRKLFKTWSEISFEPEFYKDADGKKVWRGLPFESYILERRMEWDPY